jgi:hypothetical protein
MAERMIEDRLREEYNALLPAIRPHWRNLRRKSDTTSFRFLAEWLPSSRSSSHLVSKECESALAALRRRQEGKAFDND